MVTYLFSWFSKIRPPTKHTFISNDANSEIIDRAAMVLTTHYLWCHISRCARGILSIILPPHTCNAKVSNSQISITFYNQILRFDIPMNNVFLVYIFQSSNQTSHKELSCIFFKFSESANMIPQVATCKVVHY